MKKVSVNRNSPFLHGFDSGKQKIRGDKIATDRMVLY